jgi:ABC-2 type transport system permease protein
MFQQVLAIIRNTFLESIRQPIVLVVTLVAALLVLFSGQAAFTMEDDQRMLLDMGLATLFLAGALLSAFVATSVLTREIENKTVLTVVSKPVGRPLFIVGKYIGVVAAILMPMLLLTFLFLLVEMHGVRQRVMDPYHVPVIVFTVIAMVLATGIAVWCNYFYGWVFSSTLITLATPLMALAYLFSMMFDAKFSPQSIALSFNTNIWLAVITLLSAILVLCAIAIAASTRLGQMLTLCVTIGVFLLGLLSDWIFARPMHDMEARWLERAVIAGQTEEQQHTVRAVTTGGEVSESREPEIVNVPLVPLTDFADRYELRNYYALGFMYSVTPNFQVLWLADALTQDRPIPKTYVLRALLYSGFCVVGGLAVATILFQRREVG